MLNRDNSIPAVSVLMGVYNVAAMEGFQESVQSILHQSFTDFEFIICDDGSTDDTWELIKDIASEDSRVVLLRNSENKGLAATLNHCFECATGRFIARQDADDISDKYRLEKQIALIETSPELSFCGSDVALFNKEGVWGTRVFPELPAARDFLFTMPFVHGALMFRREALEEVNAYRVAKETRRAEDYDMLMRMYAAGLRGGNIKELLYLFREDEAAQKRRKYRYRIDDVIIRYKGFNELGLMPQAWPYVIKPLIVGLIPSKVLSRVKLKYGFWGTNEISEEMQG